MSQQQTSPGSHDTTTSHVLARVEEFVDQGSPWHRLNWYAGSLLVLRELGEYGEQLQAKTIKPDQVTDAAAAARSELAKDPGLARQSVWAKIDDLLARPVELAREGSRERFTELTERAASRYLAEWESALGTPSAQIPGAERIARVLTSHLLDMGLSNEKIAELAVDAGTSNASLALLCSRASELLTQKRTRYQVVIPLPRLPVLISDLPDGGSRALAVLRSREALVAAEGRAWDEEASAGIVLSMLARDPWAAVRAVEELLARLDARLAVSRRAERLELPASVAVQGYDDLFLLDLGRRSVRVPALDRSRKTLQIGGYADADALDDALELLSTLGSGTPGAALTNGWAALEGLLVRSGEAGVVAAERVADIIAADWPRAELTWLANAPIDRAASDPSLVRALRPRGNVTAKIAALETALRDGSNIAYSRPRDVACLHRVQALTADPTATLGQVRSGILSAIRRLYVQRNRVMHAGSFRSVAMAATLRTVPALAAAGMDRIVHAADAGVTPLMLAARARVELDLLGDGGTGRALGELLS